MSFGRKVRGVKKLEKDKRKTGDPLEKKGIVGAFCRTYDIVSAIETFCQMFMGQLGEMTVGRI